MTINEFFKIAKPINYVRPRVYCKDGFNMSVQVGDFLYCEPRVNECAYYTSAEIGFPSAEEELIKYYAEDNHDYTETVYPYVPCELIDKVIEKHGGIDEVLYLTKTE